MEFIELKNNLSMLASLGINSDVINILDNNINFWLAREKGKTYVKKEELDGNDIIIIKDNNLRYLIEKTEDERYKILEIITKGEQSFINQEILILTIPDVDTDTFVGKKNKYIISTKLYKKGNKNKFDVYSIDNSYFENNFEHENLFIKDEVITDKHKSKKDEKNLQKVRKYLR